MPRRAGAAPRRSSASDRKRNTPPHRELLEQAGLRPEHHVIDIGCGSLGEFTFAAAGIVQANGSVVALDVDPEAVVSLESRRGKNPFQVKACGPASFPLHDESVDFAILGYTLHEVRNGGKFLAEVNRVLRLDGRLLVVDWRKIDDSMAPPKRQRIARGDAQAILERAGFTVEEADFLDDWSYLVVSAKDENVESVNLFGER